MHSFPPSSKGDIVILVTPARRKFPRNGTRDYLHHQLAKVTASNDAGLVLEVDYCMDGTFPMQITDKDKVVVLLMPVHVKAVLWESFYSRVFESEAEFVKAANELLYSLSGASCAR